MDIKELRKRLRLLGKQANERFPYLNEGGCCVYAAAVAEELERLNVEYEVIIPKPYDSVESSVEELRPLVQNVNNKSAWNDAGVYFGHVAVRLKLNGKWHTYDSETFRRAKYVFGEYGRYKALDGGLTAKEAKALADESSGWNTRFYRGDVRPVRQLVKHCMRSPLKNLGIDIPLLFK